MDSRETSDEGCQICQMQQVWYSGIGANLIQLIVQEAWVEDISGDECGRKYFLAIPEKLVPLLPELCKNHVSTDSNLPRNDVIYPDEGRM